jgi:catechol 2,3-dioxygenase-like lactoylglutathione lyase family enzyme
MIALSHFGINVTDVDRMADFYTRVLGLLVSDRGPLDNGPRWSSSPATPTSITGSSWSRAGRPAAATTS